MPKCEVCEQFSFAFLVKIETPYRTLMINVETCNKCGDKRAREEEVKYEITLEDRLDG